MEVSPAVEEPPPPTFLPPVAAPTPPPRAEAAPPPAETPTSRAADPLPPVEPQRLRPRKPALLALAVAVLVILAAAWVFGAAQLWDTTVPGDLRTPDLDPKEIFSAAALAEAQEYERVVRILTLLSQLTLVAVLGAYAWRGQRFARESAAGPIGTGFLLGMLGLALVWLAQLPFGLIGVWWARKHDVLDVNYFDFVFGGFFALGGQFLFLCAALLIGMGLAKLLKRAWPLPATAAFVALAAGFAFVSPYLAILEQPDPVVSADARALKRTAELPDAEVRVEEVKEWTSQPNAYATGLGSSEHVVLWDTLVDGFARREVRSVLAHELGHLEHDHVGKSIGLLGLFLLPAGFLILVVTRKRGGLAQPGAVPVALFAVVVLSVLAAPLQNAASRRYEAEADWAALNATKEPKALEALHKRFTSDALADPDPPGWWHVMFDTHPSGLERIEMARAWQERRGR